MAHMKFDIDNSRMLNFMAIANGLPYLSAQLLGFVGNESKRILKFEILSGQMLDYNGWYDKAGRRKVSYKIGRGAKYVEVSSYPANFFTGRIQATKRAPQKKLPIWKTLRTKTDAKIAAIINDFDRRYFQSEIEKLGEQRTGVRY